MQKIKLMFEFMHGPIWPSDPFTGQPMTDIKLVDNDPDLKSWNTRCSELWDECYEFNSHEQACYFNKVTLANHKQELVDLLVNIKQRLAELNHGEFILEDQVTDYLNGGS
ncbi:hypothetical protein SN4111_09880 [Ligilactobacillus agilis]|uniref:hypothetical protein n=1 Tax=Ligilactobacillus agilis TaxID=1601 RepID=UPI001437B6F7|nr:hypothetical protein [Ligilactobacillus agilis]GET14726.1 hypothetical protein SN4111_09880 [Ligilactobacillus agilis]